MAVVDEAVWPLPSVTEKLPADPADKYGFSEMIRDGRLAFPEVVEQVYNDTNNQFGTDYKPPK